MFFFARCIGLAELIQVKTDKLMRNGAGSSQGIVGPASWSPQRFFWTKIHCPFWLTYFVCFCEGPWPKCNSFAVVGGFDGTLPTRCCSSAHSTALQIFRGKKIRTFVRHKYVTLNRYYYLDGCARYSTQTATGQT